MTNADKALIDRLMFNTPVITQEHMDAATEIMPQAAARLTALLAENEALRADVARKDEALMLCLLDLANIEEERAVDLYSVEIARAALSPQRHDSPTAVSGRDQGGEG